jgi:hypothetical protein
MPLIYYFRQACPCPIFWDLSGLSFGNFSKIKHRFKEYCVNHMRMSGRNSKNFMECIYFQTEFEDIVECCSVFIEKQM